MMSTPLTSSRLLATACLVLALALLPVAGFAESAGVLLPAGVLLAAAVALGLRTGDGHRPLMVDSERFILGELASRGFGGAVAVSHLGSRATRLLGRDRYLVRFSAQLTVTEPLYQPAQLTPEVYGRFTARRVSTLQAVAERMTRELGERAGDLASRIPPDPFECPYIATARRAGLRLSVSGAALAVRVGDEWRFEARELSREFDALARTGKPRVFFGPAIALDSKDGRQWLAEVLEGWARLEEHIAGVQRREEKRRNERIQALIAGFFEAVGPGAVFHGTVETLSHQVRPTACFLEVTAMDPAKRTVAFTLRNDGSWHQARQFLGEVAGDPVADAVVVHGHTRAGDAIAEGGPLLCVASAFECALRWSAQAPAGLAGHCGDFVFALEAVPPAELPGLRARIYPRDEQVSRMFAAPVEYAGDVEVGGSLRRLEIAFLPGGERGVPAALVAFEGDRARFDVSVRANRYAREAQDVILEASGPFPAGPGGRVAPSTAWTRLRLSLKSPGLRGHVETAAGNLPVVLGRS